MAVVGETKLKVELSTRTFLIGIAVFILFTFFVDLIAYFSGLYKIKNLYIFKKYLNPATERNVPTLLSSFLFFMIGLLSFEISKAEKKRIWKVFGIFFFYLALDDLFMIHEQVGSFLGKSLLIRTF